MSKRGSTRFRMAEQRKEREITIEVLARQVPGTVLRKKVLCFFFFPSRNQSSEKFSNVPKVK